jgi:hypothetical protein
MAVMVKFTIATDVATYQAMHENLMPVAKAAGLIFHSGREVEGGIGIVDFWESAEAWQKFLDGPVTEGMSAAGLGEPDDVKVVPVLTAGG